MTKAKITLYRSTSKEKWLKSRPEEEPILECSVPARLEISLDFRPFGHSKYVSLVKRAGKFLINSVCFSLNPDSITYLFSWVESLPAAIFSSVSVQHRDISCYLDEIEWDWKQRGKFTAFWKHFRINWWTGAKERESRDGLSASIAIRCCLHQQHYFLLKLDGIDEVFFSPQTCFLS